MIFTRIKRGATRSLLLVKHKLSSSSRRTPSNSWRSVRNFLLKVMVVRAIVLPIPFLSPSSALAATTDETEPPSIVRLSSQVTGALNFTPTDINLLSVQKTDGLVPVAIGKSTQMEQSEQEAAQAATAAQAEAERQAAATKAAQVRTVAYVQPVSADGNAIMDAVGIPQEDRFYVDFIINHEGSWDGAQKSNYAGSHAYGIGQALPGDKMASAGPDWATNPVTQLRWCDGYAKGRYGGWANAYAHWITHHMW